MEENLFDIRETKEAYIQRMASYAQTTEYVIRVKLWYTPGCAANKSKWTVVYLKLWRN